MLFGEWDWDTAFKIRKEEGQQEGRIGTFCDLVAKGVMSVSDALSLSGCTQGEFSAWMQKLHPNYKM